MDEIKLPHHAVNRFERRWTARFAQMLEGRSTGARRWLGSDDPVRSPQVRRLLAGSLRPPKSDDASEFGRA